MGVEYLTEVEAKELAGQAGIPVVETVLAHNREDAQTVADRLGYPVVIKIVSREIVHKSDAGGVKLNLETAAQVGTAYDDIMAAVADRNPDAEILGVSVQQMARPGVEVIIGMSKDADFGPVLMFGLGGIFVEVLKDVSFRIAPIARHDAKEMINEISGVALLQGYRGTEPVDLTALENLLLKVSGLVESNPDLEVMDLNPVFLYRDGAMVVDARMAVAAR